MPMRKVSNAKAAGIIALFAISLLFLLSSPTGKYVAQAGQTFNASALVHVTNGTAHAGTFLITTASIRTNPIGSTINGRALIEANPIMLGLAWVSPKQHVFELEEYLGGTTSNIDFQELREQTAQEASSIPIAAALQYLNYSYEYTGDGVLVSGFVDNSTALQYFERGDVITMVNGVTVFTANDLITLVRPLGNASAQFVVLRNNTRTSVDAPVREGRVGVYIVTKNTRIKGERNITVNLTEVEGTSLGLLMSLETISQLTGKDFTQGKIVAGTGGVLENGTVTPIINVRLKLEGAKNANATIFIMPAENYDEKFIHEFPSMRICAVHSIAEAVALLEQ
jgi:Lon-like protease